MEKETKKSLPLRVYLPLVLALVLVVGFVTGLYLRAPQNGQSDGRFFSIGFDRYNKVNDVINLIYDSYVDDVSKEELTDEGIRSMLKNLDPHSSYIPARDFNRINDPLMGSFEGIGIEFNMVKDTVVVINPIAGGPSEKAGIMPGDRIIMVKDTIIAGVNLQTDRVINMLMGPKGTQVDIAVYRPGVPEIIPFSLKRDQIPSYSLDIAYMLNHEVGYMKFNKFSATTYQEFLSGLETLQQEGMEKMILDLRGNGGGLLESAILMADEMLGPQKIIVYTDGRRRPRAYARSQRNGRFETQPLVVLIDEWSASASEIIAGAVQDNDRGLIIGRRSFGKGLVQEQVPLGDGSALRLTVARYYTPTGRSIQKPYEEGEDAYYSDFIQRYHNGELEDPDKIQFDDSLRFETPAGRIVYGGGGIMPDIFIPIATGEQTAFFNQVANRGLIYLFAFDHADKNRRILEQYKDAEHFVNAFQIGNADFRAFLNFVQEHGLTVPPGISTESARMIRNEIKAYVGRNLYGAEAFFPVLHARDAAIIRSLEALYDEEYMARLLPKDSL